MPVGEGTTDNSSPGSSALPNLVKLRQLVYGPLRDTSHDYIEEWFVNDMLNEAYLDLNARLRLYRIEVPGTTSATGTVAIPADLVEVESLFIGSLPVSFVDDDTFLSFQQNGVTPYGQNDAIATLARPSKDLSVFETYPAVISTAYVLEYVARPALMTTEDATPTKLTRELIPRIVNYARAHAKWLDGQEAEGAKYMALYEQGLPGAPRDAFRKRPQAMALIPEAGPFG